MRHELTHVILADRFPGQQLPSWLNEGLAMLSEDLDLQQQRLDVLGSVSARLPTLNDFMQEETRSLFASPLDVRYAMSLSLVRYLRQLGDENVLLTFVDRVLRDGYAVALRETYAIEGGLAGLEERWRNDRTHGPRSRLDADRARPGSN